MKKYIIIFLLIINIVHLSASKVEFKDVVLLSNDKVYFKDIIHEDFLKDFNDIELNKVITSAPVPNDSRIIDIRYLKFKLFQLDYDITNFNLNKGIKIIRLSSKISSEDFIKKAKNYIILNSPWAPEQIDIKLVRKPKPAVLKNKHYEIKVTKVSNQKFIGRTRIRVEVIEPNLNKSITYRDISFYINVNEKIIVAKTKINRNDIITPDMVHQTTRNVAELRGRIFTNYINVIGKKSKYTIKKGKIITASMIEEPNDIELNKQVRIIYKTNDILLKTIGRAKESGKIGEIIKVENVQTNKILKALIVNDKTVQIKM